MLRPATSVIALALVAAALASCGEDDAKLLPGETAREITANLDTVKRLAGEGDCIGAESATEQVGEQVEALNEVDPALKRALRAGAARLGEVIADCEEEPAEAIAPAEVPTTSESAPDKPAKKGPKKGREGKPQEGETSPARPTPPPGEAEPATPTTPTPPPASGEEGEAPSGGVSPAGEGE